LAKELGSNANPVLKNTQSFLKPVGGTSIRVVSAKQKVISLSNPATLSATAARLSERPWKTPRTAKSVVAHHAASFGAKSILCGNLLVVAD
jgi:hypothetical protein